MVNKMIFYAFMPKLKESFLVGIFFHVFSIELDSSENYHR